LGIGRSTARSGVRRVRVAVSRAAASFTLRRFDGHVFVYHPVQMTVRAGSHVGAYEIVALIGAGGMDI
jgi:hypothetical protein